MSEKENYYELFIEPGAMRSNSLGQNAKDPSFKWNETIQWQVMWQMPIAEVCKWNEIVWKWKIYKT